MSTVPNLQPDELEALQAEPLAEPPVKVEVTSIIGPVRTQDLPRKSAGTKSKVVSAFSSTNPLIRVLNADHRRAVARIVSIGQPMVFAFNQASAADPTTCATWPANTVLPLTADCEFWVAAASSTTTINIMTEFWATGE